MTHASIDSLAYIKYLIVCSCDLLGSRGDSNKVILERLVRLRASTYCYTPPWLWNHLNPAPSPLYLFNNCIQTVTMSTTTITTIEKPNVGVFTNPAHELWVAESEPSLDTVKKGEGLKEGEVTIGIKSTGICG